VCRPPATIGHLSRAYRTGSSASFGRASLGAVRNGGWRNRRVNCAVVLGRTLADQVVNKLSTTSRNGDQPANDGLVGGPARSGMPHHSKGTSLWTTEHRGHPLSPQRPAWTMMTVLKAVEGRALVSLTRHFWPRYNAVGPRVERPYLPAQGPPASAGSRVHAADAHAWRPVGHQAAPCQRPAPAGGLERGLVPRYRVGGE
jgi:hypothetical protein